MNLFDRMRRSVTVLLLVLVFGLTTACSSVATRSPQAGYPATDSNHSIEYGRLARGDSALGQNFGDWVVQTSKGFIKDAFVRDDNKLGVVISPQVRPDEVKPLAQSLAQGFRKNFPNQDLTVLMYAPDKELILTARYDSQSRQVEYQAAS